MRKLPQLSSQTGFSLIELMIVVAIIGILATVAIPNYQYFVQKARAMRVKGEVGGLNTGVKGLQALYNYYPNTNTAWIAALPYGLEYAVDCTSYTGTLGAENDQAVRDMCNVMSSMNPSAPGLPALSPACGGSEQRDYLYISNGTDYQIMGYCFDHSELANADCNPTIRCNGTSCWAVSFCSPAGTW